MVSYAGIFVCDHLTSSGQTHEHEGLVHLCSLDKLEATQGVQAMLGNRTWYRSDFMWLKRFLFRRSWFALFMAPV